jgi:amino acid transporter
MTDINDNEQIATSTEESSLIKEVYKNFQHLFEQHGAKSIKNDSCKGMQEILTAEERRGIATWAFRIGICCFIAFLCLLFYVFIKHSSFVKANLLVVGVIPCVAIFVTMLVFLFGFITNGADKISIQSANKALPSVELDGLTGPLVIWLLLFAVIMSMTNWSWTISTPSKYPPKTISGTKQHNTKIEESKKKNK